MLEAFKQLHDSKKRGTQSLADVPVEHLAKARGICFAVLSDWIAVL